MRYKFQMENGHLFEGSIEIAIKNHIAEIRKEDITPAVQILIDSVGGQLVVEEEKIKPKEKKVKKVKHDRTSS